MVGHFGELARIRHVVTYSLSPFEQRAFPNYFSKGIPNVWRRFQGVCLQSCPPNDTHVPDIHMGQQHP
ncbi:hypothetical protein KUCAC02_004622 [Chaenocephalus aceratus]|uniref:Uncharacterized protein n=1 Tax=Chaenocephalus aceratus TaxID=36190 RepID=A0ACB9WZX5_CHAAC|nr:hypothetical protein KUCAC02_004622 [Chaenocephalus aceratus]